MKNLASALESLHSAGIVHKDISSESIVFDDKDKLKMSCVSFGNALDLLNAKDPFRFSGHRKLSGDANMEYEIPRGWKSPESSGEFFRYDEPHDVFCLGRTFIEVCFSHTFSSV